MFYSSSFWNNTTRLFTQSPPTQLSKSYQNLFSWCGIYIETKGWCWVINNLTSNFCCNQASDMHWRILWYSSIMESWEKVSWDNRFFQYFAILIYMGEIGRNAVLYHDMHHTIPYTAHRKQRFFAESWLFLEHLDPKWWFNVLNIILLAIWLVRLLKNRLQL
jgi:hypothetical protein